MTTKNRLFYGDNLAVLRRYVADESVDLVYLDPPFNSNASYNVLFAEKSGTKSAAQIHAFEDTWQWDESSASAFRETVERGGSVAQALIAFRTFLGDSDMLAYLAMMAPRLVEMRRSLKPTGSLWLHCDPTASHYLKMLLDAVFGPQRFVNDVSWKRSQTRSSISRSFRRAHDVLLFYARGDNATFNMQYKALSEASLKLYEHADDKGQWSSVPLLVSGKRNGETGKAWRGIDPNSKGKGGMHWVTTPDKLDEYERQGLILWPQKKGGSPRLKYYLSQSPGVPLSDFWEDIDLIGSSATESLGYPTQKPESLLDRIINASSNEGDVVLDPFCGCGTTIAAAQKLKRQWIGIDITHLAIALIKKRLSDAYGEAIKESYEIIGEPTSVDDAAALAAADPYQFQWWALSLVNARPVEQKKGKDRGIDGRIYFHDDTSGDTKSIILSVKAGHTGPDHVRDLRGTVEREKAAIGVLVTMDKPTAEMRKEAATGEFYLSQWGSHPKIQILTVADLLGGKAINRPPDKQTGATFKKAPKAKGKIERQSGFLDD